MSALFEFDHVELCRGDRRVLHGFTLTVPRGGVSVLTGPSGSGKSTVLRLCNRLLVPDRGAVRLHGIDIAEIDPCALRKRVGMVFQRPTAFPGSVLENLAAGADLDPHEASSLLDDVALDGELLERPAADLSGGELQRVCLARTLATRPEVLLVDEGTSALDDDATATLEGLISSLAGDGLEVLWVTHDLAQATRVADHRLAMEPG